MKPYANYQPRKSAGARETLPAGGYVCRIEGAKEESYNTRSGEMRVLVLAIEVVEGPYAGFWKKDFDANTREERKWRGVFRLNVPRDDGSEMDGWTKAAFDNFAWAVQESNPGYVWAWDEKTLKGKLLGVLYRNKEWEWEDKTGWTTEACAAASVQEVREGKFKIPKDKPLKKKSGTAATGSAFTELANDDGELPF